jgi:precorrin-6B methylase 1
MKGREKERKWKVSMLNFLSVLIMLYWQRKVCLFSGDTFLSGDGKILRVEVLYTQVDLSI